MNLPNLESIEVSETKIVEYLLNPRHPIGASKAKFFGQLGFDAIHWNILAEALRELARRWPVIHSMESVHGWKYIIDGVLDSPSRKSARVRTIWIIDHGSRVPRLVTAYPHEEE